MSSPSGSSICSSDGSSPHCSSLGASKGVLDVSNMEIILRGKQWDRVEDPSHKNAIHLLERNEALVTWLQPKVIFLWGTSLLRYKSFSQ